MSNTSHDWRKKISNSQAGKAGAGGLLAYGLLPERPILLMDGIGPAISCNTGRALSSTPFSL
jgi:hypothetical protein